MFFTPSITTAALISRLTGPRPRAHPRTAHLRAAHPFAAHPRLMSATPTITTERPPSPPLALAPHILPDTHYCDAAHAVLPPGEVASVDTLTRLFFEAQPVWLRALGMKMPQRNHLDRLLQGVDFQPGDHIGRWEVRARSDCEVVFTMTLPRRTWCLTLRLDAGAEVDHLAAVTRMRFERPAGRLSYGLLRRFHHRMMCRALRNTVRTAVGLR